MSRLIRRIIRALLRAAKATKAAAIAFIEAATATVKKHPKLTALAVAGLVTAAAPCIVVKPVVGVLNLFGFGAGGVVGGSVAAMTQAGIGNVVTPSFFATATSAAAGGYGVASITGVVQLVGGITAVAATTTIAIKSWFGWD
ncbi:hypothetical protein MN608_11875 [Microdochium nivale]|nr:hypothetical protein MN608_11875 [Microdochium nivale]